MPSNFYECFRHEAGCSEDQCPMEIAQDMLTTFNDNPDLLKKIITGDESWVYGYDSETKAQSLQWKRPKSQDRKKARQVRLNMKVLLNVFFDCNGVVHHEFLAQGHTVNKEYYLEVMHRLREAICQKHTKLWKNQSWILHPDNAPAKNRCLWGRFWPKINP